MVMFAVVITDYSWGLRGLKMPIAGHLRHYIAMHIFEDAYLMEIRHRC